MFRYLRVNVLVIAGAKRFLFDAGLQRINQWAIENKVVTSSGNWQRGQVMITHGPIIDDLILRAVSNIDRILRGANPGDLPIEQPTRFEVLINGKTAKAMGLKIPQSVMLQATEVIE